MKNLFLILCILLTLLSCNLKSKNDTVNTDSTATESQPSKEQLKTLNEIKLALLDARCEKADLLLGNSDKKGRILADLSGDTGFLIYYDKVMDNGKVKNLLIIVDSDHHIGYDSKITDVKALDDYQSAYIDHGVSISISKHEIKCNGRAFKMGDGNKDWFEVY